MGIGVLVIRHFHFSSLVITPWSAEGNTGRQAGRQASDPKKKGQNVTSVKYDGTRQFHDLLVNLHSKWLRRAKISHMSGVGGFKRTSKGLFTDFANQLPAPDPNSPAHASDLQFLQASSPVPCLTPGRSTSP